jgi:subtilase family serine protease
MTLQPIPSALSRSMKRLAFGAAIVTALLAGVFAAGPTDGLAGSTAKLCTACTVLLVPDLSVQTAVVVQRGADFEPHFKLKITVANNGRGAAGAFDVQVVAGAVKPARVLGTFTSSGLDVGKTQTFFQALTSCNQTLSTFVDPTNRVLETNEQNNAAVLTVTC